MPTSEEVNAAISAHGAKAVYDAANRQFAGDKLRGLASVGLVATNLAEVDAVQTEAFRQLGPAARAIDHAQVTASLERLSPSR